MPKWVWGLFAGGGVLLIVVVVMVVMIVRRPPQQVFVNPPGTTSTSPAPGGTQVAAVTPTPAAKTPGDSSKAATPTPTEAPKTPAADDKKDDKGHDKKGVTASAAGSKHHTAKAGGDKGTPNAAAPAPADTPAAAPVKKKPSGPKAGGDALDDLLSGATGGKDLSSPKGGGGGDSAPKHQAPAADDPNLPDQLKLGDIQRGMSSVRSRVSQCYAQFNVPGVVNVTVSIAPSGHVQSVQVTGKFAGTPTGDCVAKATKGASFPRFKGAAMTGIDYPWMLQK
jgi:hypothetical protein